MLSCADIVASLIARRRRLRHSSGYPFTAVDNPGRRLQAITLRHSATARGAGYRVIRMTPVTSTSAPMMRDGVMGCGGTPSQPKWSITNEVTRLALTVSAA